MSLYSEKYIEINNEAKAIFEYWKNEAYNAETKQFFGAIDFYGKKNPEAPLGIIMYSRILWSFSAASMHFNCNEYKAVAEETFNFIQSYFYDKTHKGYFWEISAKRTPLVHKKQTYAHAFMLYGICEYYACSKDEKALKQAISIFDLMQRHCIDTIYGGFFEAFAQDWTKLDDVRLSEKDRNDPKSMNTNLHVLEAYTRLLQVTGNKEVELVLRNLINLFAEHIIDKNGHLCLFFDEQWKSQVNEYSFGHDIETSWLLWEAIEAVNDEELEKKYKSLIIRMVDVFLNEALDENQHSSLYHKFVDTGKYDTDRHWWVMCEMLEGLANAYEITNDEIYRKPILPAWEYIKLNLIDCTNGEWHWRVNEYKEPIADESKVCNWKAPYHNGRALMRLVRKMQNWQ